MYPEKQKWQPRNEVSKHHKPQYGEHHGAIQVYNDKKKQKNGLTSLLAWEM